MLSSLKENIASVAYAFSVLWYSFVQHKACVCWLLAFAFSTMFHFILSSSIILVWKARQILETHIFICCVWNCESIHFSK